MLYKKKIKQQNKKDFQQLSPYFIQFTVPMSVLVKINLFRMYALLEYIDEKSYKYCFNLSKTHRQKCGELCLNIYLDYFSALLLYIKFKLIVQFIKKPIFSFRSFNSKSSSIVSVTLNTHFYNKYSFRWSSGWQHQSSRDQEPHTQNKFNLIFVSLIIIYSIWKILYKIKL